MNNKQKVILPIAIAILLVAVYFSYLSWNTWNNRHKSREFSLQLVDYEPVVDITIMAETNDYLFSELEPITTHICIEPLENLPGPIDFVIYIKQRIGEEELTRTEFIFEGVQFKIKYEADKSLDINVDESKENWLYYNMSFSADFLANSPGFQSTVGEKIKVHPEHTAVQTRVSQDQHALTIAVLSLGLYSLLASVVNLYFNANKQRSDTQIEEKSTNSTEENKEREEKNINKKQSKS